LRDMPPRRNENEASRQTDEKTRRVGWGENKLQHKGQEKYLYMSPPGKKKNCTERTKHETTNDLTPVFNLVH